MTVVGFLVAFFKGMAAVPQILAYVKEFAAAMTQWWIEQQTQETHKLIADAAAASYKAKNQEERYAAAEKWRVALNRPRVS